MIERIPLPEWLIDADLSNLQAAIQGYRDAIPLLEARCREVAERDRTNARGIPCDEFGTLTEYRLDGKYCAGQVVRLTRAFRLMYPETQWDNHPLSQLSTNPRELAPWAWLNPWKGKVQTPVQDVHELEWKEFFLRFTERERRALVYTIGCKMPLREAAEKMGITVRGLRSILLRARQRFGPNLPWEVLKLNNK